MGAEISSTPMGHRGRGILHTGAADETPCERAQGAKAFVRVAGVHAPGCGASHNVCEYRIGCAAAPGSGVCAEPRVRNSSPLDEGEGAFSSLRPLLARRRDRSDTH
mmetsp:Transcript_4905/g.12600  ORF Transcript_4905/g.12600 Transcript_4905/m.12600 type:complete len:106 (+) Transcript_4905:176-493(+)